MAPVQPIPPHLSYRAPQRTLALVVAGAGVVVGLVEDVLVEVVVGLVVEVEVDVEVEVVLVDDEEDEDDEDEDEDD